MAEGRLNDAWLAPMTDLTLSNNIFKVSLVDLENNINALNDSRTINVSDNFLVLKKFKNIIQ